MKWLRSCMLRLGELFRKNRREDELSAEMESHLQFHIEDNLRAGMSPTEARREALLKLGGVEQTKEIYRHRRGLPALETLLQDLRYGARMLRKTPGFTLIAVTILALGIGSNTAVFSLIDALLLRSLAVPAPQELIHISFGPPGNEGEGPLSGPLLDRLRERQSAFNDIFSWTNAPMVLTENGVARPIQAAYATGSAFPTLKLQPRLGRLIDWRDDETNASSNGIAANISEAFWIEHFRGEADVLGKTIIVNGFPATIVGVMPRSFNGITVDYAPQVVLPLAFDVVLHGASSARLQPDWRWLFAMGRLKPGISLKQAQANIATVGGDVLNEALPVESQRRDYAGWQLSLGPGRSGSSPLGQYYGRSLWTLQALVGLLFLICCANLAGLQLSRSLNRQHELVVRSALGARRLQLVRQLVIECGMLALAGAAAGIVLSQWMSSLLVQYVEQSDFPVFLDLRPNAAIFAWTVGLAAITVILSGALPALSLTRFDTEAMLRSGTQRSLTRKTNRLAARLLPLQVALSVLLISIALLFAFSTGSLLRLDPGFRVKGVTLFDVDFERRPEKGEARIELYRKMLDALQHSPGVEAASVLTIRPLGGAGIDQNAAPVEGNGTEQKHLFLNMVGPDYFATAGTKVLAGREFSALDRLGAPPVCIVNQTAANFFFPGQNVLAKHIRLARPAQTRPVCEIVGVVIDAKYNSVREPAPPTMYFSYEQVFPPDVTPGFITRSEDTSFAVAAFADALHRFAPDTPLMPAVTMQRQLEDSVGQERLLAALSLFFGSVALLLSAIGLYGLESQRVTQRTSEIGLRLALGAQRRDVRRLILREAALIFATGMLIGLALMAGASRFVGSFLYELSPLDPRVLGVAVFAMLGAGWLAAYLPARRAMRVDPIVALRYE
jgi:putative ABC transport system permease protein